MVSEHGVRAAGVRDLIEVSRRVRVTARFEVTIRDDDDVAHFDVRDPGGPELLTQALYARLYCRPTPSRTGTALESAAALLDRFESANNGRGSREWGWRIEGLDPEDGRFIVERDGIRLWVRGAQFGTRDGETAERGRKVWVAIPKEFRHLQPGFYAFVSDASGPDDSDSTPVARLYWHLTEDGAETFVRCVSQTLNATETYFRAKVVSQPGAFNRADAAVIYLERRCVSSAMSALREIYETLAPFTRPKVPMFTSELAPGLGVADAPLGGMSFGLMRCRIVADAILRVAALGATSESEMLGALDCAFVEAGLDPSRPHLSSSGALGFPTLFEGALDA